MSSLEDLFAQFWQELASRPSGPLAFRFILQPVMAAGLAIRDGYKDVRANRTPYLWGIAYEPAKRGLRIREGLSAVARVVALGVAMDVAYQIIRLDGLRPLQTVIVVFTLCFLPYVIVRGPAARIARLQERRKARQQSRITAA
jgi:hypothetical protein